MKKMIPLLGSVLLLAAACKKDAPAPAPPAQKSKKDYLIEGKWQINDLHVIGLISDSLVLDVNYDSLDACGRDDYFLFKLYGKLHRYTSVLLCDSVDQDDTAGTWTMSEDYTQGSAIVGVDSIPFTLVELSASSMLWTRSYSEPTFPLLQRRDSLWFKNIN